MVQWLGLHASTTEGLGSIPGQGTKIPNATWWASKQKKKKTNTPFPWFYQHFWKGRWSWFCIIIFLHLLSSQIMRGNSKVFCSIVPIGLGTRFRDTSWASCPQSQSSCFNWENEAPCPPSFWGEFGVWIVLRNWCIVPNSRRISRNFTDVSQEQNVSLQICEREQSQGRAVVLEIWGHGRPYWVVQRQKNGLGSWRRKEWISGGTGSVFSAATRPHLTN